MTPEMIQILKSRVMDQGRGELFADIYGSNMDNEVSLQRIASLIQKAPHPVTHVFSAPGRTELGGNHTDHNHGKVLCAAVRKDALAVVCKREDEFVIVRSEGFEGEFRVELNDLSVHDEESGSTTSLIRGGLAGIQNAGGALGGFEAYVTSDVAIGSGLSSSAAFEVLMGTIINHLFNQNTISAPEIARIGQFAENTYFGKPCGLMDQMASSVGGVISIDFKDPAHPSITEVPMDLTRENYQLLVVDTGGNHADLTPAYASIPQEMLKVAQFLGVEVLRQSSLAEVMDHSEEIRSKLGDRAVLRAIHFFRENERVDEMVLALQEFNIQNYLTQVASSGDSSSTLLQNVIPPGVDQSEQGVALAVGLARDFFLERGRGVARVHGGGFAGTMQAYVHMDDLSQFTSMMVKIFGAGSVEPLGIRQNGACELLDLS